MCFGMFRRLRPLSLWMLVLLAEVSVSCISRPEFSDDDSLGGAPGEYSSGGAIGSSTGGRTIGGSTGGASSGSPSGGAASGGAPNETTTGGSSPGGAASGGAPSGGAPSGGSSSGGDGSGGEVGSCTENNRVVSLVPLTTKQVVYVLADGSSSLFEAGSGWDLLDEGVLPALEERDAELRLGFGYFSGQTASCTGLTNLVPVGDDNASAVRAAYDGLVLPTERLESPTSLAIEQATELLAPLAQTANVTLVLVSDGNGDFCDDSNPRCGVDAQVTALQMASVRGIHSIVVAATEASFDPMDILAQAGAGQFPAWDDGLDVGEFLGKLESECALYDEWSELREAHGNAPHSECGDAPDTSCHLPAGHYSEAGGTATAIPFGEASAIDAELGARIDARQGCSFALPSDLSEADAIGLSLYIGDALLLESKWRLHERFVTLEDATCSDWLAAPEELNAEIPCQSLSD